MSIAAAGKLSGRYDFDARIGLLGKEVRKMVDRAEEWSDDATYGYVYRESIASGDSEDVAEGKAMAAESEVRDDAWRQLMGGIDSAWERMLADHDLRGVPEKSGKIRILPVTTWRDAAKKIRDTVNGMGPFYFSSLREMRESGPYTYRELVLSHLGWMHHQPEVYGDTRYHRIVELAMR